MLPDTTYLERYDCISLAGPPDLSCRRGADAIRHPVVKPDRDVRPFQEVLLDLGCPPGTPNWAWSNEDGSPTYPGGYPDYIVNHQRRPGIGPLAGWRGKDGEAKGRGGAEPGPDANAISMKAGSGSTRFPTSTSTIATPTEVTWTGPTRWASSPTPDQIVMKIYSEALQKFKLAGEGHGPIQPPERERSRIATYFDPLPIWYPPMEGTMVSGDDFPLHAITQRPMQMYHSWGSQNAWLRQITSENWLHMAHETGKALGIAEGDWVWVTSHNGRIKVQVKLMDGVNKHTVWTWNAIGKRPGAWNLDKDVAEATRGFLLNHLISELLPADGDKYRHTNSDPVTGQAAWFDLRVRVERAADHEQGELYPQFEPTKRPPNFRAAPAILRYGEQFRRSREIAKEQAK